MEYSDGVFPSFLWYFLWKIIKVTTDLQVSIKPLWDKGTTPTAHVAIYVPIPHDSLFVGICIVRESPQWSKQIMCILPLMDKEIKRHTDILMHTQIENTDLFWQPIILQKNYECKLQQSASIFQKHTCPPKAV